MKIDEYDPAIVPIPIVNAKSLITPEPKMNMNEITSNNANTVPIDLLMVCRRLSSNICPSNTHLWCPLSVIFSLTLSKMMMVSLMEYPMLVRMAMMNIVSTVTVGLIIIRNP